MSAILGGGLSGLSTAYYLIKNNMVNNSNLKVFLFEATGFCGGWVKTLKTKDYTFEQGPRTIRPKGNTGVNTLNMLEDLGLSEHVAPIGPEHPAAKNRLIYAHKNLHVLPSNLKSMFTTNGPFSKPLIYSLFRDLTQPGNKELQDDSIYNFVSRRFGQEVADYAIAPMICGICAGDAKEISVKFLMKTLFELEQNHGSVLMGLMKTMFKSKKDNIIERSELAKRALEEKWSVYSLKGGLETFPLELQNYLSHNNVNLNFDSRVNELVFQNSNTVVLKGTTGELMKANHVYATIPAHSLSNLVAKQHPDLAQELKAIPFVTVGLVNLYYAGAKDLTTEAFGFLVPPIEDSPILGVVFDSCCLPDQNGTVLTVMLGGKWYKEKFGENITKQDLLEVATKEIARILNIKRTPTNYHVNILHNCIPQYIIGHYERVDKMRAYIQEHKLPLSLVGCSYDGVGINDVIYSAKVQVEEDLPEFKKNNFEIQKQSYKTNEGLQSEH